MKFGARYPTAASLLEYVVHAFGNGHLTGVVGWLLLAANAIITAMVAVSFGSYAGAAFADGGSGWTTVFAVLVVVVMTVLNVLGSHAVARAQTIVVVVVIGILALAIATVVYVAVALGVFGTLTVDEVVESGGTALAVAAEPVLGSAGYWLTTVTALFATAGATNAGLYPAAGLCEQMASMGQFPPLLGRNLRDRAPAGLLVTAVRRPSWRWDSTSPRSPRWAARWRWWCSPSSPRATCVCTGRRGTSPGCSSWPLQRRSWCWSPLP